MLLCVEFGNGICDRNLRACSTICISITSYEIFL